MVDLGNRLRHAYHRVEPDILWEVAQRDLPPLKAFVERVIREIGTIISRVRGGFDQDQYLNDAAGMMMTLRLSKFWPGRFAPSVER